LLNQRSAFILMGVAEGSREQAEEWDRWMEGYRETAEVVDAALQSHRIVDHVVVKILVFGASWWELADGPMRFAAQLDGMSAAYLVPRDGRPMPDITTYSPPDPARDPKAALAASVEGKLSRPDLYLGALRPLRDQAEAARVAGNLAEANTAMLRAFEILSDTDGESVRANWRDAAELALAAQRLADSMYKANQADAAEQLWILALAVIGPLAPDSPPAADLNRNLGALYRARGDLDDALTHSERALHISLNEKPRTELAFIDLALVAAIRRERKELDEARRLVTEAITLAEMTGVSDDAVCRLLHTAGDVDRDRGDRDAARGFYERALSISEASDPFSGRP
jgi:tetratricopeptide (TPR) repeat protein